jgi:hypothetical protein
MVLPQVSEEAEYADHEEHDCDRTKSNHQGVEHSFTSRVATSIASLVA